MMTAPRSRTSGARLELFCSPNTCLFGFLANLRNIAALPRGGLAQVKVGALETTPSVDIKQYEEWIVVRTSFVYAEQIQE